MAFPFIRQPDAMDCGPACIKMVAEHYGKKIQIDKLREKSYITREGVSFLGISEAATSIGFRTLGVRIPFSKLKNDIPLPCIVHWKQKHFIVVYRIRGDIVYAADPAIGLVQIGIDEFIRIWAQTVADDEKLGLVMVLQPTPEFYELEDERDLKGGFRFLYR